ncbi:MAG: hypothetical protein KDD33_00400 [Bdellovibrionales bacterium]|nr:hypothetical protein [Bdellovibrionales bacterium]
MILTAGFILLAGLPEASASTSYMNTNPSRVLLAIEAHYGIGSGVGGKEGSCLLCHTSSAGGSATISGNNFGEDFRSAANRLGLGNGSSLPATGSNSLETIFADSQFGNLDSDNDGTSNGDEFLNNSDPASDGSTSGSGGGGGGCGMIAPTNNKKGPQTGGLLLMLPLLLITFFRKGDLKPMASR